MTSPNNHAGRLLGIDALRGISILLVLVDHANSYTPWPDLFDAHRWTSFQFNSGLVLFFVISGFCMTMAVLSSSYVNLSFRERLVIYSRRRFWRIQPIALLWVAATVAFSYLGMYVFGWRGYFGSFEATAHEATYAIIPVANFKSQEAFGGLSVFNVYWTLALEEQFYLLFPFLVFTAASTRSVLIRCLVALAVCSLLFRNPYLSNALADYPRWQAVTNALWFQPMLMGAIAFFAYRRLSLGALQARRARLIGFSCLAIMPWPVAIQSPLFSTFAMPALCAVAVLCSALSASAEPIPGTRLLAWVGVRSYGIYLAHIPVSMLNRELWEVGLGGSERLAAAPIQAIAYMTFAVLLLASVEAIYRWVELPLIAHGRKQTVDPTRLSAFMLRVSWRLNTKPAQQK